MTTETIDEVNNLKAGIGLQLSEVRKKKGYSIEYVASTLHLRTRIIELIENSEFNLLPEPVFIKGYIRAYSKLLGVSPDPYLTDFNNQYVAEKVPDRALWQSKRESHKGEHIIRWFTVIFAVGVLMAVGVWWQTNKDNQQMYSSKETTNDLALNQTNNEIKLTDLSKMQSLLRPEIPMSKMEKQGG